MKTVFKFKKGSYIKGDAQAVGEKLTQIRKAHGALTAYDVVQEARRESSVLHQFFEWRDDVAAEEYRKQQARHLIACVVMVSHEDFNISKPIRAFVNLSDNCESSYEPVIEVMSDETMREQLLAQLQTTLDDQKGKLEAFEELSDVVQGIETVQEVVTRHRKQSGQESRVAGG